MPLTRRTLTRRIAIAAVAALILAPGAGVRAWPPRARRPIKVGFSSAMTGPSAITGEGRQVGGPDAWPTSTTPRAASWAGRSSCTSATMPGRPARR
jgi:hypothetical protein